MSLFFLNSGLLSAQENDDIYFDGVDKIKIETAKEEPAVKSAEDDRYEDDYVDEEYEYAYSARIRRFHQPARGFSYYSNYYVDNYWYDPFMPGVNIYNVQPFYAHHSWGWAYPYGGWGSAWGSNYGWGWSNYSGYYSYFNYGFSPYWGNQQWGYRNPYWGAYNNGYWSGYNQGYWNGWYGNNWNSNNSGNWGWFESSAPNAANFVTNRQSRSSDTGIHRSRNTPVPGYDTEQRLRNNAPDNRSIRPETSRDRNSVRPNLNNPNTRQPNVRPNTRQPNIRIETKPNTRQPERNNPPSTRELNPTRGNYNPPVRTIPERSRNNNSFNNNINSGGMSPFRSTGSGNNSSGTRRGGGKN